MQYILLTYEARQAIAAEQPKWRFDTIRSKAGIPRVDKSITM
jgi:hypothetical protein